MLKINLLILLIIIPFVSFSQITMGDFIVGEKLYVPPSTLEEMIENVKDMSANNAPRKEIASWMARVIDHRITNMNSVEYFFDTRNYTGEGNELFDEYSDRNIYDYETSAKWAWNNRMGNCEENSNIVYYILKQAGVPKDFRQLATIKHQFTVWGLVPGAELSNPDTWGPNAIVIDPWLGYTLDSDRVKSNKWYQNGDPRILPADATNSYDRGAKEWISYTCPDNNPEPGKTSDQYFPKNHKGTYTKCRYHYPSKFGEILASKIGYRDNKKVIAEYFDSRNFLSKRIEYDEDGIKKTVTNFYDNKQESSISTYNADGTRSTYKALYKDGREK